MEITPPNKEMFKPNKIHPHTKKFMWISGLITLCLIVYGVYYPLKNYLVKEFIVNTINQFNTQSKNMLNITYNSIQCTGKKAIRCEINEAKNNNNLIASKMIFDNIENIFIKNKNNELALNAIFINIPLSHFISIENIEPFKKLDPSIDSVNILIKSSMSLEEKLVSNIIVDPIKINVGHYTVFLDLNLTKINENGLDFYELNQLPQDKVLPKVFESMKLENFVLSIQDKDFPTTLLMAQELAFLADKESEKDIYMPIEKLSLRLDGVDTDQAFKNSSEEIYNNLDLLKRGYKGDGVYNKVVLSILNHYQKTQSKMIELNLSLKDYNYNTSSNSFVDSLNIKVK